MELLNNVRGAMLEVKSLVTLRERLAEETEVKAKVLNERVSGSKTSDTYNKVVDYVDFERIIIDKLKALQDDKLKAFEVISTLVNIKERVVLMERYLNAKSWKAISSDLNLSIRHLQNIHRKAILHLNQF